MLQIKNLKKHFGGVKAVDNCSFVVKEKTITALIGPNGAGKSTIFNLVSGILRPEKGKIVFDGKDVTNSSVEKISNLGISRLFQQTRLFNNLTVKENLFIAVDEDDIKFWKNLFGLHKIPKEKEEAIKEMLKLFRMEKFENKLCRDLSFGQKRLIELSRTILNPHKLLMLDEPVAGVTPKLRKEIAKILKELKKKGETIFLIEHDMNFTLKIADEVVVMDEGKVIAKGKPSQIRKNKKVLEAYLGE